MQEKSAESTDLNLVEHITSRFFIGVTLHEQHLFFDLFKERLARVNDLLDNLSVTHLLLLSDRVALRLPLLLRLAIDVLLDETKLCLPS